MAEVHQGRDLNAVTNGRKTKIIYRIMRYAEWFEINVADTEKSVRIDLDSAAFECIPPFCAFAFAILSARTRSVIRLFSLSRNIDRAFYRTEQNTQPRNMVAVLVGY